MENKLKVELESLGFQYVRTESTGYPEDDLLIYFSPERNVLLAIMDHEPSGFLIHEEAPKDADDAGEENGKWWYPGVWYDIHSDSIGKSLEDHRNHCPIN